MKQHTWVSSPLQVRPSLMFNCGIRDYFSLGLRRRQRRNRRAMMETEWRTERIESDYSFVLLWQFKKIEGRRIRILDDPRLMILSIEDQAFVGHHLERQLDRLHGCAALDVHHRILAEIALR